MSEEILKALAQLYAIIAKQDSGNAEQLRSFVVKSFTRKIAKEAVPEYVSQYDEYLAAGKEKKTDEKERLTSMKDSVKTLAICKKINKTLTQKQKVVVLAELLEMVQFANDNSSAQGKQIIETVSEVFNILPEEHKALEAFILERSGGAMDYDGFLIVNGSSADTLPSHSKHMHWEGSTGNLVFLYIKSVEMAFLRHWGGESFTLNGKPLVAESVVVFPQGSILKSGKGKIFFYSDIISQFHSALREINLSFSAKDIQFTFPNGTVGLREINILEGSGQLIAIMGASGAGKTTLLNVLAGLESPSAGKVLFNGIDIHQEKQKIKGAIGYIPQDDLLIEELTVFENLYYSARLCYRDLSKHELNDKVSDVLSNLGLLQSKDLKVGNALNKTISGGQRKRLNFALELIREPSVMFIDEPTSGLSSRDSENVVDLLKELSLKGTLIFVVIHQPSSDIYKMFDKVLILDTGGFSIFYGNPIEAVSWFKRLSMHADHEKGQCETCGSVNPEQIFNIIEERVVDEYGNYTNRRKINTSQWVEYFKKEFKINWRKDLVDEQPKILKKPGKLRQLLIYAQRDLKSKISNRQYMLVNLLEAPVLALILAFIIRYNNTENGTYIFRFNENIPAYLLMSVIVAIFMGLSVSAEELIKDRKIRKRESLLNLSRLSYLSSKLIILFSFSAVQTLAFILVGNAILEIKGMIFSYWLVLFSTSCMANLIGLFISSGFNSAVTVYILIPMLLIPQMILSGAMFSFDKINDLFKHRENTPLIADVMISRWAFEALAVDQFTDNEYQKSLFPVEQIENIANFNIVYRLPELLKKHEHSLKDSSMIFILDNELRKDAVVFPEVAEMISTSVSNDRIIKKLEENYQGLFADFSSRKDKILTDMLLKDSLLKDNYFNESLAEFVRNISARERIYESEGNLLPGTELIYFNPLNVSGIFDYRSHFCAPVKNALGNYISTYWFNILVLWIFSLSFFIGIYYDFLNKSIVFLEKILKK